MISVSPPMLYRGRSAQTTEWGGNYGVDLKPGATQYGISPAIWRYCRSPMCWHLSSIPSVKMFSPLRITIGGIFWLKIPTASITVMFSRFPGCRRKAAFSLASIETRMDFLVYTNQESLLIHVVDILRLVLNSSTVLFSTLKYSVMVSGLLFIAQLSNARLYTGLNAGCRERNLLCQLHPMRETSGALIFPFASKLVQRLWRPGSIIRLKKSDALSMFHRS